MTSGELLFDGAALMSAAQEINAAGESLATDLDGLSSTVSGSGNPWGADEPGSAFGQAYALVLGHALETLGSHVQLLATAAQGLVAWAETTTAAEQANTAGIEQIGSQL